LVVQIDGIHITEHLVLVAAVGIDGEGIKQLSLCTLFDGTFRHFDHGH